MAGNRNLQSLSNLVKTISRLSQNSTETRNSGETQETTDDVEATIRTLFPSTNGQLTSTQANRNETRVVAEHGALDMPDRRYSENAERFVPNRKYGTNKRPRNVKNSTSKKSKCNEQRTVLKDVILLHGPKQDKVPRGIAREALFALGFTTTLELSITMQESEIRGLLEEKFKNKLESISRKGNKFQFVRGINSKIISLENINQQECQAPCDGRLLKHISGQGPLYIRANEDISAPLQAYFSSKQRRHEKDDNTDDEMESESSTGDEEAIMRNTMHKPRPTPIVRVDLSNLDDGAAPGEDTGESSTTMPSTSTSLAPEQLIRVRCPTCEGSFSSHEIEDHADGCAEAAWTGSEHLVYARLMADIETDDQDPLENQSAAEDNNSDPVDQQDNWDPTTDDGSPADIKAELIGTLQTLQTNLNTHTNRINVQRTSVLDDYIDARKRSHWMRPENRIKVVFIGEPAIDTGGPKREFCSDVLGQVQDRLFDRNGMPVASTLALTQDLFKYAGELMAISIIQGGLAPNFLSPVIFDVIAKGLSKAVYSLEMIEEPNLKEIATQIDSVDTDADLQSKLMEDNVLVVLNQVGYRGIPNRETLGSKDKIVSILDGDET